MAKIPIRFRVFENSDSACAQVAAEISQLIRERAILGRQAVIGLIQGKTPLPLYEELIYLYREEGLSFRNVVVFNLVEYDGMNEDDPHSSRTTMHRTFFDHIDLPPENIHFLRCDAESAGDCEAYELKIAEAGGIDLQLLGIGRNGHIGFNEPETPIGSRTSRVELSPMTRDDAVPEFGTLESVPTHALTMGCGTILETRKIILMAWGTKKARVVRRALLDPVRPRITASYLRHHPSVQTFLDQGAASQFSKRF